MRLFLLICLVTNFICGCNRKVPANTSTMASADSIKPDSSTTAPLPACILAKIDSIRQQPVWNPPAEIHEYELDGRRVYLVSADCCDRFTTAMDSDCKTICAPSGGFTGRGDGKCPDFFKKANHIRLVWKDDRERNK